MRMGLREANQRFSKAVKAVRAGREVILTDRGTPIAVIRPLPAPSRGETAIRRLEAAGLFRPAPKSTLLPAWKPRRIKGAPLSATLREERDVA